MASKCALLLRENKAEDSKKCDNRATDGLSVDDNKEGRNVKVFLGGTCSGWKWRDELQPLLKCEYYNPIVKNWSEDDRLREVHERETSDYVLYGITNGIKGVYSIAEVVDDSNKRPEKTIFLNLYKEDSRSFTKQMGHSLKAVENLLKSNGAMVFDSVSKVASFLNLETMSRRAEDGK